jgi:hypothetical protein
MTCSHPGDQPLGSAHMGVTSISARRFCRLADGAQSRTMRPVAKRAFEDCVYYRGTGSVGNEETCLG